MKVISSQRYLDEQMVADKLDGLAQSGAAYIECPIIDAEMTDLNGEDVYVMIDNHHTLAAARELGLEIRFETVANPYGDLHGDDLLEQCYMDSDWYYVETGTLVW